MATIRYANRTSDGSPSGTSYGGWSSTRGTIGTPGALPPGVTGQQGTAYTRTVQPDELVENRMNGLLSRNSEWTRVNEDAAYRRANARGIADSSVGLQAGRLAAIESALPIATADAGRYGAVGDQNLGYLNQMALQQEGDATSRYNAELGHNASIYGADMGLTRQREDLAYQGEQAGLQRSFQDYMARQGFAEQQIRDMIQQGYGQQNAALDAGLGLLSQSQNFRYSAGLSAMNNPYILQNQEAFGGFMNWIQGDAPVLMNDLFNMAFGLGGNP